MKACIITFATLFIACTSACTSNTARPADGTAPSSDDPDWVAVRTHFEHPDGTLTNGVAAKVLAPPAADAASALPSSDDCPALLVNESHGTCQCKGGGTWDFDADGDKTTGTRTFRATYHACDAGAGAGVVEGRELIRTESDASFIVFELGVTSDGKTAHFDTTERVVGQTIDLAVQVDTGWVTLDRAKGIVRDRTGSWTCSSTGARYSCSSAQGLPQVVADR